MEELTTPPATDNVAAAPATIDNPDPAIPAIANLNQQANPEHIMQFFAWLHLPEHLQVVSAPFGELAEQLVTNLPRNPERTVALRKLLEAKDAAVRAQLAR